RHTRGWCTGGRRRMWVAEEKTGKGVFGLVHADHAAADDAGADLQTGLLVGDANGSVFRHRKVQLSCLMSGKARHVGGRIDAEGPLVPVALIILQFQIEKSPQNEVASGPED